MAEVFGETAEDKRLEKIFLKSQTDSSKIASPIKQLFTTPAREAKFSDFCDSALKKKDETRMITENMVSPGPTAMKQTFKEEESLESPKLEGTVMRNCFQVPGCTKKILKDNPKTFRKSDIVSEDIER